MDKKPQSLQVPVSVDVVRAVNNRMIAEGRARASTGGFRSVQRVEISREEIREALRKAAQAVREGW